MPGLVPTPERSTPAFPWLDRVHWEDPQARQLLTLSFLRIFSEYNYTPDRELVTLCIGTDRSTGDALGPLTGSKLLERGKDILLVYGTLDQPVHAANLGETCQLIRQARRNPFIIAVDACLGKTDHVGYISVKPGPLRPGTGVNKNNLPPVGDMHVVGVVNVGGFMEYLILQNTRLSLVIKMADIIADALWEAAVQVKCG